MHGHLNVKIPKYECYICMFTLHVKADSIYGYTIMHKCFSSLGLLVIYRGYSQGKYEILMFIKSLIVCT